MADRDEIEREEPAGAPNPRPLSPHGDTLAAPTEKLMRIRYQQLKNRLLLPPEKPSWGPKVDGAVYLRRGLLGRLNNARARSAAASTTSGIGLTPAERQRIDENYELHRRIAGYKWMYILAAIISAAVAIAALVVDYHIVQADVWTRALSDEFGIVPESMANSVFFKSLQVVFATLAVHLFLKVTGKPGRFAMITAVFLLTFIMVGGLGFVVANNNLAAGTSGVRAVATTTESPRLGDALAELGIRPAAAAPVTPAPAPSGTNVAKAGAFDFSLSDWLNFDKLPEQWRMNAQSNIWLIFVGVVFFIITVVAALYLQIAERNVRNTVDARDFKQRKAYYREFMQLEERLA